MCTSQYPMAHALADWPYPLQPVPGTTQQKQRTKHSRASILRMLETCLPICRGSIQALRAPSRLRNLAQHAMLFRGCSNDPIENLSPLLRSLVSCDLRYLRSIGFYRTACDVPYIAVLFMPNLCVEGSHVADIALACMPVVRSAQCGVKSHPTAWKLLNDSLMEMARFNRSEER